MKKTIVLIVAITFLLSSCTSMAGAPTSVPSAAALPTLASTPIPPTNTPPPTAVPPTATPVSTATPEKQIFRDDFSGQLQSGWSWESENPQKWSITGDGWLQITGEDATLLANSTQNNLLWHELPGGDYVITVHIKGKPLANFHQIALFIYEDSNNYVAINHGFCDMCQTGGPGIYMEYKVDGKGNAYMAKYEPEDLYLQLVSQDKVISGFYGPSLDALTRIGRFGNYFDFKKAGIGVSNCGSEGRGKPAVVGLYDYFEITRP